MARRKRLSGEEARKRILEAASAKLREVGPQALTLSELGKELGISHQAILHHFGSRDGLVAAVVERAMDTLSAELTVGLRVLGDRERGPRVLIDRAFEVLVDQGHGRLFAWLALARGEALDRDRRNLAEMAELLHEERADGAGADLDDSRFLMVLLTYAILGAAVFQEGTFAAVGLEGDDAETRFRRWLSDHVVRTLDDG
jgi:AcrR family transcriptional regulator